MQDQRCGTIERLALGVAYLPRSKYMFIGTDERYRRGWFVMGNTGVAGERWWEVRSDMAPSATEARDSVRNRQSRSRAEFVPGARKDGRVDELPSFAVPILGASVCSFQKYEPSHLGKLSGVKWSVANTCSNVLMIAPDQRQWPRPLRQPWTRPAVLSFCILTSSLPTHCVPAVEHEHYIMQQHYLAALLHYPCTEAFDHI